MVFFHVYRGQRVPGGVCVRLEDPTGHMREEIFLFWGRLVSRGYYELLLVRPE